MPRTTTTITKDRKMPPRGRGAKNLILESMRRKAVLGLNENSTKEEAELAFFDFLAEAAFNPTKDTAFISNTCLSVLSKKGWPDVKPSDAIFEFEYNPKATLKTRIKQVSDAVGTGILPVNIGQAILSVLINEIEATKVLNSEERIRALEKKLKNFIENEKVEKL